MDEPLEPEFITVKDEEPEPDAVAIAGEVEENDSILGIDSVYNPNFQDTTSRPPPLVPIRPVRLVRVYVAAAAPTIPPSSCTSSQTSTRTPAWNSLLRKDKSKPQSKFRQQVSKPMEKVTNQPPTAPALCDSYPYPCNSNLRVEKRTVYHTVQEPETSPMGREAPSSLEGSKNPEVQLNRNLGMQTPEQQLQSRLRRRAEATRRRRAMETPEKRERRLRKQREANMRRLTKERHEQLEQQLESRRRRGRDAERKRRALETPEQYERRLGERMLYQRRQRLAMETPEQSERRLRKQRETGTNRLAMETPEQREKRLRRQRETDLIRRTIETPAQREMRRRKQRKSYHTQIGRRNRALLALGPEEYEKLHVRRRAVMAAAHERRQRRYAATFEQGKLGLEKDRVLQRLRMQKSSENEGQSMVDKDGDIEAAAARLAAALLRKQKRRDPSHLRRTGAGATKNDDGQDSSAQDSDNDNNSYLRTPSTHLLDMVYHPNDLPETPTQCPKCNKEIPLRYMELHIHHHEDSPRPKSEFGCAECGKTYHQQFLLQMHQKQVHQTPTAMKCSLCEKDFKDRATLNKHLTKTHQSQSKN